ncbi:shikimate kinase [Microbacterium terricola]|uniref:Shikimate kinase n=1 Tax=Microbacterium terricola TaxID=344163 RepID=A0ABM8DYD1_9MICO|nr:shikimate kinase [Microbacterium terricola]UYK38715.1 shikimate kinase [Microbacterium terricola]BDV30595.1 shikimate kinase [Microbacterium terricola]
MTSADAGAIVLVGPMGAGKTSVGRRVARALGTTFTDTDKMVVREHGPIPELFVRYGEAHFRGLERAAVTEALAGGGVVALGGGAVLDAGTRAQLAEHRVVLLTVAPHIVSSRILGSDRPLLAGEEDPIARWQRIFDERLPLYEQVADVTFDTSTGPLSGVVTAIVDWAQSTTRPEDEA